MLIDTDVFIWLLRGHTGAASRLQEINPWKMSTVTHIELLQGARNKQELAKIQQGLEANNTQILPINTSISQLATQLIANYTLTNGLQLADALIAATALQYELTVLTGNNKHFSVIDGLKIEVFQP